MRVKYPSYAIFSVFNFQWQTIHAHLEEKMIM